MERYSNLATTTLASGIDDSVTSLTVTDPSSFPTAGTFRLLIEDELLTVTGVSGSTFTVTRGAEGTSAAAHTGGNSVAHIITAGSLNAVRLDQTAEGALPSDFFEGRTILHNGSFSRRGASSWKGYGPVHELYPPDDLSGWAWANQGTGATINTHGPGYKTLHIPAGAHASGNVPSVYEANFTGTTVEGCFTNIHTNSSCQSGLGLRDASTGVLYMAVQAGSFSSRQIVTRIRGKSTVTNTSAADLGFSTNVIGTYAKQYHWQKLVWNSGAQTITLHISDNGVHWVNLGSISTTGGFDPDKVCLTGLNTSAAGNAPNIATFYSLKVS